MCYKIYQDRNLKDYNLNAFQDYNFPQLKLFIWQNMSKQQATFKLCMRTALKVLHSRLKSNSLCGDRSDIWSSEPWAGAGASWDGRDREWSGACVCVCTRVCVCVCCVLYCMSTYWLDLPLSDNIKTLMLFTKMACRSDLCFSKLPMVAIDGLTARDWSPEETRLLQQHWNYQAGAEATCFALVGSEN